MRRSFAQLKARKTFSGGVVDKTMKQIFPFTRIGYDYNFTSDVTRLLKLSRPARRVLVPRALDCLQCGDFFIRHFLFLGRKEVFPISTQQYYDFQKLLIVKLLNYLMRGGG